MSQSRVKVIINWERCKGCQLCIHFCPHGVLGRAEEINQKGVHPPEVINQSACTGCTFCGIICPDLAIEIYREIPQKAS